MSSGLIRIDVPSATLKWWGAIGSAPGTAARCKRSSSSSAECIPPIWTSTSRRRLIRDISTSRPDKQSRNLVALVVGIRGMLTAEREREKTHSSTLEFFDFLGPSKVHRCPACLHRLQGGVSLPIHFIFIRWQKSCGRGVIVR